MSVMFLPLRLIPSPVQAVVLSTVLDLFFTREGVREQLQPLLDGLEGRVFHVCVEDTGVELYLGFSSGHPWVHTQHAGEADVRIDATTAGFSRLCFAKEDPDELVFQRVLRLAGDSEAMLRFKKLLAEADIDYERELKRAFGDYFGARVAAAARAMLTTEQKLEAASRQAAADCVRSIDAPDAERLQQWQAGVESLSRKASRLSGRLTKIEKALDRLGER